MHNGVLAKKYQVSPTLTRKECPARLGVTYPRFMFSGHRPIFFQMTEKN